MKKKLLIPALILSLIIPISNVSAKEINQDTKPSIAWEIMYSLPKSKQPKISNKDKISINKDINHFEDFESHDNESFNKWLEEQSNKKWDGNLKLTIYPQHFDYFKITKYTLSKKKLKSKKDWKFKYLQMPKYVEHNGRIYKVSNEMFPKKYRNSENTLSKQYKEDGLFYHVNSPADMKDFVKRAIKWHKDNKTKDFPKAYDDRVMYVLCKDGEGLPLLPRTISNYNYLMNNHKLTAHGMYQALMNGLVWSPEFKTFVFVEELCDSKSPIYKHYIK